MDFQQFLKVLEEDEAFRAELAAFLEERKPDNVEARYAATIEFAAAKGYTVTVEELSAEQAVNRELDDDELDAVSGAGDNPQCSDGFKDDENCMWNDKCNHVHNDYKLNPECNNTYDKKVRCAGNDACSLTWNWYEGGYDW